MLYPVFMLAAFALGSPPISGSPLLVLDAEDVRRGDLLYGELWIYNHTNEEFKLPEVGIWSKLSSDAGYRNVGRLGGGRPVPARTKKTVLIGQIAVFSKESLSAVEASPVATVYAGVGGWNAFNGAKIAGTLAPDEAAVLGMLYASWNRRTPPVEQHVNFGATIRLQHLGLKEAAWNASEPEQLEALSRKLNQDTAVYRLVKVVKLSNACLEATETAKLDAVAQLIDQLASCGTAERKWFTRRLQGEFLRCGDLTSRKLFLEGTPPEDYDTPATGELSLEISLDRQRIRRGEPCYCEVRLHNYGLESQMVNAFAVGRTLGHRAMLFGTGIDLADVSMRNDFATGGAMIGGGDPQVELAPNAAMVTWLQIQPFSYTTHDAPSGKLTHAIFTAQSGGATSLPYRVDIEGEIGKRPGRDIVRELYVDFKDHPGHDPKGMESGLGIPQIKDFLNNETPWPLSFPPELARLRRDLTPDTPIHRIVTVVEWSHDYLAATTHDERRESLSALEALLTKAGPSERRWLVHRLYRSFGDTFPDVHRAEFLQSFPEADQDYRLVIPK